MTTATLDTTITPGIDRVLKNRVSIGQTIENSLTMAARGLINWSQGELADRAGVSRSTVKDFETERHALHHSTERLLIEAIEAAGVSLIAGDEAGPGVRFKRPV